MRQLALALLAASALAACGGQSAQQREQARVAKCQAQARQWAQNYVQGLGPGVSSQTEQQLAQSDAQVCIDGKP